MSELAGLFIRGAVFSEDDDAIYLLEANHKIFKCLPQFEREGDTGDVYIRGVSGAENLQQAQIVRWHWELVQLGEELSFSKYVIETSKGECAVLLECKTCELEGKPRLKISLCSGYPPEDAVALADFSNDKAIYDALH